MRKLLWCVGLMIFGLVSFAGGFVSGRGSAPPPGDLQVDPGTLRLLIVPRYSNCPDGSCVRIDQLLFPTYEEPQYLEPDGKTHHGEIAL